jgi:hypothetical protein
MACHAPTKASAMPMQRRMPKHCGIKANAKM